MEHRVSRKAPIWNYFLMRSPWRPRHCRTYSLNTYSLNTYLGLVAETV